MIHKVFAVYDEKAGYYTRPFMFISTGEALRVFIESANNPEHAFCKHAGDFSLFDIGEYDDADGMHSCEPPHVNLGKAIEFKTTSTPRLVKEN